MSAEHVSHVRDVVDPNRTLPLISLELEQGLDCARPLPIDEDDWAKYGIFHQNEKIGEAAIYTGENRRSSFGELWINEDLRGKGFGLATYVAAIELCARNQEEFFSDTLLTEDSLKVWQRFASMGVAAILVEFKPADPANHVEDVEELFEGRARII